jgi:type VI secretion system protein VasI
MAVIGSLGGGAASRRVQRTAIPAADSVGSPATSPSPTSVGQWIVSEESSDMDDSKSVTLSLAAENEVRGWLATERPHLVIRCEENKTEVYVRTGMAAQPEYGRYSEARVEIRMDSGSVRKQWWSEATNNEALFAPQPVALAKQLAAARQFRFRFSAFNAGLRTATFDLTGLSEVLPKVSSECGWRYRA